MVPVFCKWNVLATNANLIYFQSERAFEKKVQNLFHLATMWVLRKNPCIQSPFTVEQLVGFLLNSFRQYEPIKYRMFNCVHYQICPNTWCSGNEISYHSVSNFWHALRLALIWSWNMQNNALVLVIRCQANSWDIFIWCVNFDVRITFFFHVLEIRLEITPSN